MTTRDDELLARLRDPDDPRTPLHFKKLEQQRAPAAPVERRFTACAFHRTTGYRCGPLAGASKPISKLFGVDDAG